MPSIFDGSVLYLKEHLTNAPLFAYMRQNSSFVTSPWTIEFQNTAKSSPLPIEQRISVLNCLLNNEFDQRYVVKLAAGELATEKKLSGGQIQRLMIARTIFLQRPVSVFDEPFSNLDDENARVALAQIRKHLVGGIVIVITHSIEKQVAQLSDIIIELNEGKDGSS